MERTVDVKTKFDAEESGDPTLDPASISSQALHQDYHLLVPEGFTSHNAGPLNFTKLTISIHALQALV